MITKLFTIFTVSILFFAACDKKESKQNSIEQKDTKNVENRDSSKDDAVNSTQSSAENKKENVLHMLGNDGKKYELFANYDGLKFKGYEGKVLILDFFATWCPPCRAEIPHLVHLQDKYKDKIQVFSVLMEENKDSMEVENFIKQFNINYPVLNSKENFFLSQALGGIRSLPTLVVYDTKGGYFTHFLGAVPEEMLESAILKALKK
ncbi:MAG: TlpA family protein disulfide reductase [Sulfurospirillum sp.]|nr:MAG: TlpA family protein disulfide reductase [Sulfurospirillum sp.]